MRNASAWLLALAIPGAAPVVDSAQPPAVAGPSFRCSGQLSPTEALICRDAELRAYDRAVAFVHDRKVHLTYRGRESQRAWMMERDRCGDNRACVLEAYRDWIGGLSIARHAGSSLNRIAGPPATGEDLMLGTLQSPTGKVKSRGHSGYLFIKPLGASWYLFQATATFFYGSSDGRGANLSTSEAAGLVRISRGSGTFTDERDSSRACSIQFTSLQGGRWKLIETGGCSGLGSSLTGIYGR